MGRSGIRLEVSTVGLYLGVDFGTSTMYVTRWHEEKHRTEPVSNLGTHESGNVFPNVIYYDSPTEWQIGHAAEKKGTKDPANFVSCVKRGLEQSAFKRYIPNVGRELTAVEIARDIFICLKKKVEHNFGGESIAGVVISVPFAFQHAERGRIKRAAEMADLKVLGLIEEPVAAALSFGLEQKAKPRICEKVLVFDLGGGTFDVAAFKFVKQAEDRFVVEVLGTDGNKHLGGIDIDEYIFQQIREKLEKEHEGYRMDALDVKQLALERAKLTEIARQTKENVATYDDEQVFFSSQIDDQVQYDEPWEGKQLEETLKSNGFIDEVAEVLDRMLFDLEMKKVDIDRIILVGGTCAIPAIQEQVQVFFGKAPEKCDKLDEMVGAGAGIYCGMLLDKKIRFLVKLRLSKAIGLKQNGRFKPLLSRNAPYGDTSDLTILPLKQNGREKKITVYQGDGAQQSELAAFTISSENLNRVQGRLGLTISTDKNGMVGYAVYDVASDDERRAIASGMLEI